MKSNTITVIIVTILLIGGAYWYFVSGTGNQQTLTVMSSDNSQQTDSQKQFQALVKKLHKISFNTSIFSNPKFRALINITTPIAPESLGRLDPFASISSISVNTVVGTTGQ